MGSVLRWLAVVALKVPVDLCSPPGFYVGVVELAGSSIDFEATASVQVMRDRGDLLSRVRVFRWRRCRCGGIACSVLQTNSSLLQAYIYLT